MVTGVTVMKKTACRQAAGPTGRSRLVRAGALAGALLALSTGTAAGQALFSSSGGAVFRQQLEVLDGRAAQQYSSSDRLQPKPVLVPGAGGVPAWEGDYRGPWLAVARDAARRHGIPENIFLRLIERESGWDPAALSPKGAVGLAQLMPDTAARLGVDASDPAQNLEGGARYLRQMYDRFRSWRLALAAYNAGPEAVEKFADVPPYAETQGYVSAILGG